MESSPDYDYSKGKLGQFPQTTSSAQSMVSNLLVCKTKSMYANSLSMYRQLELLNTKHRKTDIFNSYDDTQLLLSSPKAVLVTFQTYLDVDIGRLGYISTFGFVNLKSGLLNFLYMCLDLVLELTLI